jgi:hypothetical protein
LSAVFDCVDADLPFRGSYPGFGIDGGGDLIETDVINPFFLWCWHGAFTEIAVRRCDLPRRYPR